MFYNKFIRINYLKNIFLFIQVKNFVLSFQEVNEKVVNSQKKLTSRLKIQSEIKPAL